MNKILNLVLASVCVMILAACGSSKQMGYQAEQKAPVSVAQQQSANRGVKLAKEECEEMALEQTDNLRASGNGVSVKEAFALNLALLDARQQLARQLETMVNGLIRNFDQQHEKDGGSTSVGKASAVSQEYFEQFLRNTRPICKNTYVKEDGKYNVYVCVELGSQQQREVYKKLSSDGKLQVDFQEHKFLEEFNKAKEDYRQQQLNQ